MDSVVTRRGYSNPDDVASSASTSAEGQGTRRRNVEGCNNEEDEGVYDELQRLRDIVDAMQEGDRRRGWLKLNLNNSTMSTIFGFIFIVIVVVPIYAFVNLYRALVRRFSPEP